MEEDLKVVDYEVVDQKESISAVKSLFFG